MHQCPLPGALKASERAAWKHTPPRGQENDPPQSLPSDICPDFYRFLPAKADFVVFDLLPTWDFYEFPFDYFDSYIYPWGGVQPAAVKPPHQLHSQ